ncbi:PAS domain-containing protein [Hymenobacter sp. 5516J-16]|uniref:PAS domain-containing sensor histidine kinase n=1 Tax=Hymenobacter sp. 5516J-16 TaxID=2932253 RepID=UPI001FD13DFF|nr:PAS domain-containing protein [Hymenobacter sp. 5516J-16]UOQ77640.1 PAS domain-containing protein [Hymenobacter sp. 5516J-16]
MLSLPLSLAPADELLPALLDLSISGIVCYTPVLDAAGQVLDFVFSYVNPAAQRLLGMPAQPTTTYLQQFPQARSSGAFAFHVAAFGSDEPRHYEELYQDEQYDTYCRVVGRRLGQHLLVSFSFSQEHNERAAEQALRQSQAREQAARAEAERQRAELTNIFEQAPVAIAIFEGPDHVIKLVNAAHLELWGKTAAEVLHKPLFEAIPEAKGAGYEELLAGVMETEKPFVAKELSANLKRHGQQELVYFDFVYLPWRTEQGTVSGVIVVATDITQQVKARQQAEALQADLVAATRHQVQERNTLFQVFAQTPAAICIQRGPDHRYEYANAAYLQFFPGRQILGNTVAEAIPETVDSGVLALLDHVYQTGETYYGEELPLLIAQPEGPPKLMYFTFTYQAFHENGEIVGISTFAYNVADQVLARQQHEVQQRRLHELFEQAPVAIAIFRGPQYVIELANPAVCAIWGRTPEQALGTPLFELLPEAAGQGFEQLLDGVMATGVPYVANELPSHIDRHGRRDLVYWNFVYQPLHDGGDQITAVTVVATEVTEQVLARQRVQDLNQELAASNDELSKTNAQLTRTNIDLDTFVYTASHDLKAPITNIESIMLALREHLPREVQQHELISHLLDLLDHTVARFQTTIAQLTDLSKLQLAHAAPAEPVLLAAVVEDVRLDLAPDLQAAATQLTVEVAPDLLISFAPQNLRSIVYNLLSNAVKYRDPNRPSRVQLRAESTPQSVLLTVQDNGLGLNELQQRQLFGLFQRLHTHVEGTGVGLYIVKRLVENGAAPSRCRAR